MPTITINGTKCDFTPGQTILQAANTHGIEIPQYCYHDGLSIVASCRICLAEAFAPNSKTGALEPYLGGKLFPTCQTPATDGLVVYSDSPKAIANQKAVMEYLLINHPLDCPVCDQSGECFLQDYSYMYGRGVSRFEETKVKNPKKDLGPHVYLYSDRCIMCTRCVRFTREVSGTSELLVMGRGNKEEIDIFPGVPIDNALSGNVIDLCPVGALLDKDFLFAQRVWFLKETPSIDPLTASGDNIAVHHNEGKVYRVKPRDNPKVNKWWITDEVRYGWKFVHSELRLLSPMRKQYGTLVEADYARAYDDAVEGLKKAAARGQRIALSVSPMLSCEDAYWLGRLALTIDPGAVLGVGPVPVVGKDQVYPPGDEAKGFKVYAEKAPNARGVRRVLEALSGRAVLDHADMLRTLGAGTGRSDVGAVIVTGNYPAAWAGAELLGALAGKFTLLIDTLASELVDRADILLPGATFAEKTGTFENARNMLQGFEQAIQPMGLAKPEAQIALDMLAVLDGAPLVVDATRSVLVESTVGQVATTTHVLLPRAEAYNAAHTRQKMAQDHAALSAFATQVAIPTLPVQQSADMSLIEL